MKKKAVGLMLLASLTSAFLVTSCGKKDPVSTSSAKEGTSSTPTTSEGTTSQTNNTSSVVVSNGTSDTGSSTSDKVEINYGEFIAQVDPSCTEQGFKGHYLASDGKYYDADKNEVTRESLVIDALGHDLVHHDAVPATALENGTKEYWECSRCHTKFLDAEGTRVATDEDLVIEALGFEYDTAVVTWTGEFDEDGVPGAHVTLSVKDDETIPTKNAVATVKVIDSKEPTCTEAGYIEYEASYVLGETTFKSESTKKVDIEALGHDYTSTYEYKDGKVYEVKTCETCGDVVKEEVTPIETSTLTDDYLEKDIFIKGVYKNAESGGIYFEDGFCLYSTNNARDFDFVSGDTIIAYGKLITYTNGDTTIYEIKDGNILAVEPCEATIEFDSDKVDISFEKEKIFTHDNDVEFTVTSKNSTLKVGQVKINGKTIMPEDDGKYIIPTVDNKKLKLEITLIDKCEEYVNKANQVDQFATGKFFIGVNKESTIYYLPTNTMSLSGNTIAAEKVSADKVLDIGFDNSWDVEVKDKKVRLSFEENGERYYLTTVTSGKNANKATSLDLTKDADKAWATIDGDGDGTSITFGNGRTLGLANNGKDFRAYSGVNNNSGTQKLSIYSVEKGLVSNHKLVKTNAVDATCEESGNKEYYTCSECGRHYEDDKGEKLIADIDAWLAEGGDGYLAPLGHDYKATFTWENEVCFVTISCEREGVNKVERQAATVTETDRVDAIVGKDGCKSLVASYVYDGKTFTSDEEIVVIPALEPEYKNVPDCIVLKDDGKFYDYYKCTNSEDAQYDKYVENTNVVAMDEENKLGFVRIEDVTSDKITLVKDVTSDVVITGDKAIVGNKTIEGNITVNGSLFLDDVTVKGDITLGDVTSTVRIDNDVDFSMTAITVNETITLDVIKTNIILPAGYKFEVNDKKANIVIAGVVTILHEDGTHNDYADFSEAISNLKDKETLKLLDNITIDGDLTLEKEVTINLNDLELSVSGKVIVNANTSISGGTLNGTFEVKEGSKLNLGLGHYSDANVKSYIDLETLYAKQDDNGLMEVYIANYEVIPAVAPTCEETGLTEGKRETISGDIIVVQQIILALGHNYGEWKLDEAVLPTSEKEGSVSRVCSRDNNHVDTKVLPILSEENYTITVKKDSTCTEKGIHTYTLKEDETIFFDVEDIELKEHTLIKHDREEPTCEKDGNIEYYECSVCHKLFSDEKGEHEIDVDDIIIEKLGHIYVVKFNWVSKEEVSVTVTCERDDKFNKTYTLDDGCIEIKEEVTKEPTCTEVGTKIFKAEFLFEDNNEIYNDTYSVTEEIPASGHSYKDVENEYEIVDGKILAVTKECSVCGEKEYCDEISYMTSDSASVEGQKSIIIATVSSVDKNGYVFVDEGKFEFYKPAKNDLKLKAGDIIVGYGEAIYFKNGKIWEFKEGCVILAKLTKVDEVAATCEGAGVKKNITLVDDGVTYYYDEKMQFIGNETAFNAWKAEGGEGYIAPEGHLYTYIGTLSWNEDHTECTFVFVCANDENHTHNVVATIENGGITVEGRTTTAKMTFEGATVQASYIRLKTAKEVKDEILVDLERLEKEIDEDYLLPASLDVAEYEDLYSKSTLTYVWTKDGEPVTKVVYTNPQEDTQVTYVLNVGDVLVDYEVTFTLKKVEGTLVDLTVNATGASVSRIVDGNTTEAPSQLIENKEYTFKVEEDASHIVNGVTVEGAKGTYADGIVTFTAGKEPVTITVNTTNEVNLNVEGVSENATVTYCVGDDTVGSTTVPSKLTIGSKLTIKVSANDGYLLDGTTINGASTFEVVVGKTDVVVVVNTIKSYKVTFDRNDGSSDKTVVEVGEGHTIVDKTSGMTREGYAFDGWYEKDNEGNLLSESFAFDATEVHADITLYARWVKVHTVTFNSLGGSEVSALSVRVDAQSVTVTKPTDPTKEGFTFAGWFTSEDEGVTLSETEFDFTVALEGDVTLYAKWEEKAVEETAKVTLTASSFGLKATYETKTIINDGVTYIIDQGYLNGKDNIQMNFKKGNNGILYNDTAFEKGIKSITVTVASGNKEFTITVGNEKNPSKNEKKSAETVTYEIEDKPKYFQLKVSGASYFSSIEVEYYK